MQNNKKNAGWGWIVFWFIVFFPVGIYLMVKKIDSDKQNLMNVNTKRLKRIGIGFVIFGCLGLVATLTDSTYDKEQITASITVVILFTLGGFALIVKAINLGKVATVYREYINLIVNNNIRSLDEISNKLGISYETALKNVNELINKDYLKDAYVDLTERVIVLKAPELSFVEIMEQYGSYEAYEAAHGNSSASGSGGRDHAVKCSGCGATNVIKAGKLTNCEYCGTPVSA